MTTELIERRFASIGARVRIAHASRGRPEIDVGSDRRGELFVLRVGGVHGVTVDVVEADRDDRALLLLVRDGGEKSKFLCGFDERHWFVAAIPERASGVGTVEKFMRLPTSRRRAGWVEMVRNPELYAKGAVRHPDHATIVLHGWHRVLMNTEQEARAMRHVAFLD
jgi:hypothetical protein